MRSIDAVYTWVDDSDEAFRAGRQLALSRVGCAGTQMEHQSSRFRDGGELRYSIRSLEQHAPWLRRIFLVTNGQRPHWLDNTSNRIVWVRHEDIFPDRGVLPTFNSNAIEMNLHRIPRLSEKFLYFNDDIFLGRPVTEADFLGGGHEMTHLEPIFLNEDLDPARPNDRACLYTLERLRERWGDIQFDRMPAHVPRLLDRTELQKLEAEFPAEFAATRGHAFRTESDFVLKLAYAAQRQHAGHAFRNLEWGGADYMLVLLTPDMIQSIRWFAQLLRQRPKMFCINDDLPEGLSGDVQRWLMRVCLQRFFPKPSSLELKSAGRQ